ncbi:hypothetical protein [Salinibacterium sp. TMP30]|uniref:hypothetical protein n=1 Tax=Salinibacterium sp. TMP30 TaxID=3138237 RepID=UPI00313879C2
MQDDRVSRDPVQTDAPRPRLLLPRALLNRGILAALAFIGPVFGVLYVIVLPDGHWLAVVVAQLAAILLACAGAVGYFRSAIWIGPDSSLVTERGFFGQLSTFDKADAASILLAEVYTSDGSESRPQLVVLGANKRRLLRMRGQYWTREDMNVIVAALDVPVHSIPETVSMGELRNDYPHALYVLERRPLLVVLVAVGGTALTAAILILVLGFVNTFTS